MTTNIKTTEGGYDLQTLIGDFLLSGFGMSIGLVLLLAGGMGWFWTLIFAVFFLAALWFFHRTWRLFKSRVVLMPDQKKLRHNQQTYDLATLQHAKLRFYGSYRQRKNGGGTYQLNLTFSDGSTFWADQRLDVFQDLVELIASLNPQCDDTSKAYFERHSLQLSADDAN